MRDICLSFPEVEERVSHGHPAWFIRGKKLFAAHRGPHDDAIRPCIWCAAPPGAQEALVRADPEFYFRPPYVGQRGWLGMFLNGGVDRSVLEGVLIEAYVTVAPTTLRARLDADLQARG